MKRRTFVALGAAALAAPSLRVANAQAPATVRWWYHFDNPQHSPADLVAKFERENPGIKVQAESIPWGGGNDYYTRLYAAIVAGNAPDCGMVKLANLSRLMEMRALEPLDTMLAGWAGTGDIPDTVWNLHKAGDGKSYYLPLQYVVLYLYYRADLFQQAGVQPPKTFPEFLAAAKATTKGDVAGFGMRGGGGGHDHWGTFVLGGGATFDKGGMVTGIIPQFLSERERMLHDVQELIVTDNMHQRKHKMFEKSDAFVALPGGIGTVEEIIEIMTWGQLGHHRKPIVFGNIGGFWDPMLTLLDHMRAEGFIHTSHLVDPLVVDTAEAIVPAVLAAAAADGAPMEGVSSVIENM